MSATASVSNPAAVAAPGQASGKPGAAAQAGGALGAFDAIMAAFFASMEGTSEAGAALATGAQTAGTTVVTDEGKPAFDTDAPATVADADASATAAATPDAALTLALMGLGVQAPSPAPATPPTAAAEAGASAGGAPAAASAPTPQVILPQAGAADLIKAEAGATSGTDPVVEAPEAGAPNAAPADAAPSPDPTDAPARASGDKRATPTPPGLAHMAPSALEHSRVAQAAQSAAPAPAAEPPPAAPVATPESAAQVIEAAAQATPAATAKPADKAEKGSEKAPRAARTEASLPAGAARVGGAAPAGTAPATAATAAPDGAGPKAVESAGHEAASPPQQAEADVMPAETSPAGQASAQAALPTRETLTHAPAATPVRGSPETVASLSAHLIKKLDERASQFDLQLDPVGLGRVDVRLQINARGQVTAAMSFDNPQAAAELKARSAELQQALEQAGFDISGGMSFDVADQSNGGAQQQRDFGSDNSPAFRGRAFQAALDTAGEAANAAAASALYYRQAPAAGVDVRI